ncbi:MAG: helix-turn-helix domain-containing protein [Acidimicrobiales bacterium]
MRELQMSQTLLHPEQVADLVDEYRQGVPVRELAERYGVHRQTVSDHARRHGLAPRHRTLSADERALIVSLRQGGSTLNEIAERVRVSERTVRNILRAEGAPTSVDAHDTARVRL